jgi:5-carboxymethyl-2-hydroxymuconate isomerase
LPYLLVEYSANLEGEADVPRLLRDIHEAAARTELFDRAAIRSRAVRRDIVVMGDGDPNNAFVLVTARIRRGRGEAERRQLGEALLEAASTHLDPVFVGRSMALNVEVQEIEGLGFRRHGLRAAAAG